MPRSYLAIPIADFLQQDDDSLLGKLSREQGGDVEQTQIHAWLSEFETLRTSIASFAGHMHFEYSIPRMGERIDVLLLIESVIFVLEFKVGSSTYSSHAVDQVWDYALDLKNFHETSHDKTICPILIATEAKTANGTISYTVHDDQVIKPLLSNTLSLSTIIEKTMTHAQGARINATHWAQGGYYPTPTIIEAATRLYNAHSVHDIARSDASAINLTETTDTISDVINQARAQNHKAICFVTGVPGAGKTLVGLNVATKYMDAKDQLHSVYLSGNGPLVKILVEALARDRVRQAKARGEKQRIGDARSAVKAFIQNIHHFRDEYVGNDYIPPDHVVLFDEAQRAWDMKQTCQFMKAKKGQPNFSLSEPAFLIQCMDRLPTWAVIVCLVGGGQEINKGEAGISEWLGAIRERYPDWHIHVSPNLTDSEYQAQDALQTLGQSHVVEYHPNLHLAVSMRSFRAETVSDFVKCLLDLDHEAAEQQLRSLTGRYPIAITRDFDQARKWIRAHARGSERYGLVVSSRAERLKPYAIDVKSPINPVHWFLNEKDDVRSSYYMEVAASEFAVQGLELDWACVAWDADFRFTENGWMNWEFKGKKWMRIRNERRQLYQKNAYRVLLTRARQGMVIVVPRGDADDHTRDPAFYDATFEYLGSLGLDQI